jgi:glucose-fructose oxidoreductase
MDTWKVAALGFDHMHMGDHLRLVEDNPRTKLVALCDTKPEQMSVSARNFGMADEALFADIDTCLETTQPDLVVLCPTTADHAKWVTKVAEHGVHVLLEKPMAATLQQADAMIAAMRNSGKRLAVNWPLVWVPAHVTTRRLIEEGMIGQVREVHYYDGNRGPLWHTADKREIDAATVASQRSESWFYRADSGGGSLLDYLGYGVTLGTWYLNGQMPLEVTSVVNQQPDVEVDEQSVTVVKYDQALSTFQTRWGTFTDPWVYQPQPKCGFVITGSQGTIASYDYAPTVRVQTEEHPQGIEVEVDTLKYPRQNPLQYFLHCLESDEPLEGPLSPEMSRQGQQIVEAAILSAREKRTVSLAV